jgi:hypothetical protein
MPASKRKAFFKKASRRAGRAFLPDHVITVHTFDHTFDYHTFRMAIPPCFHLDMVCVWGVSLWKRAGASLTHRLLLGQSHLGPHQSPSVRTRVALKFQSRARGAAVGGQLCGEGGLRALRRQRQRCLLIACRAFHSLPQVKTLDAQPVDVSIRDRRSGEFVLSFEVRRGGEAQATGQRH